MIPFQNANGINGASVVNVPDNTGKNISPAAIFAAFFISTFPLSKIRCVFSITTTASSTTIPKANRKANNTIMFNANPILGKTKKATKQLKGTERATKKAFVTPIKNINTNVTNIHDMNFIQDINMVRSIVKYRKLEIKKQIRIISLSIEVYKYVLIKIKCEDFFSNEYKIELNKADLLKDRQKCVEILQTAVLNDNSYFLQDTLCRYIELEDKLKSFSKKNTK